MPSCTSRDGARVDEGGRAHLHRGAARDQELERVLRPRDPADPDHRDAHRARRLVGQVHGERPDRRAGEAAGPEAEPRRVGVEVDRHADEGVDRAQRVGAGRLDRARDDADVGSPSE